MDKAITTALLIIAGVVCMIFLFNSVYPMINHSSQAMASMAEQVDERMNSRISIVHCRQFRRPYTSFYLDKKLGTQQIDNITKSDLFFGQQNNFQLIRYVADAGGNLSAVGILRWKMIRSGKQAPR